MYPFTHHLYRSIFLVVYFVKLIAKYKDIKKEVLLDSLTGLHNKNFLGYIRTSAREVSEQLRHAKYEPLSLRL